LRSRRAHELGSKPYRYVPSGRHLRRPHPQGREARRPTGHATDQVRVHHQLANGASARIEVPTTLLATANEVIE
jgi:hypothetical protein